MIDEALKRAGIILGETKWCMADLQDAMLRFADERLEKAAKHIERINPYARDRAIQEHCVEIIRSYKSTPPPPSETKEQRYEKALRKIAGRNSQPDLPKHDLARCPCVECIANRALEGIEVER